MDTYFAIQWRLSRTTPLKGQILFFKDFFTFFITHMPSRLQIVGRKLVSNISTLQSIY